MKLLCEREGCVSGRAAVSHAAVHVCEMVLREHQRPSSESQGATPSGSSAAVVLPWLVVLLGRCATASAAAQAGGVSETENLSLVMTSMSVLHGNVEQWLQAGPVAAELSAMGYAPGTLLQQLQDATGLLSAGLGGDESASQLSVLTDVLQAASRVLTCFAVPHCCNNPACVNAAGPSEAQLVNGRGNLCGGCRVARYCSRACLRQHWGQHKPVCKALAAAAPAATTAAAAAQAGGAGMAQLPAS